MDDTAKPPPESATVRTAARLSFAFLLDEITAGVAGLEPLDALLVLAINQANIVPLTRDPDARARYGQLDAPAPDDARRPVSTNAIAGSLGLPFETARRRIRRLVDAGVCAASRDGVIVPASFLVSPAYLQSVLTGHERLRAFYFECKAAGLAAGLPPPNYGLEGSVPVRAAARLLSDYVLRASEGLMREAGAVVSVLAFVALLAAALAADEAPAPQTLRALARRLRLPDETVRRHVAQLVDAGLCARTPRGLAMPPEALARPGLRQLFEDNAIHVHRLLAGLAERGVILAWETGGALDGREMA
jgi:predicted transcriptional regulator